MCDGGAVGGIQPKANICKFGGSEEFLGGSVTAFARGVVGI